jgi:hypothetical protein
MTSRHQQLRRSCTRFIRSTLACTGLLLVAGPVATAHPKEPINSPYKNYMNTSAEFEGKVITAIEITIKKVFEDPNLGFIYRGANAIKIQTRERVIRREILLSEGDIYNEFMVRESERFLRQQKFLTNVNIKAMPDGDGVKLVVFVQDTWTLVPTVNFASSGGAKNQSVGIADTNLFGLGKRLEFLDRKTDQRQSLETVYEDLRVWSTDTKMVLGYFDRNDGNRSVAYLGHPFRTFFDTTSWSLDGENSDLVGRLYRLGSERYIFKRETNILRGKYIMATGSPTTVVNRYSVGATYSDEQFSQASLDDYQNLDLDPTKVSNDVGHLAKNRKFVGPSFGFQSVRASFVSMNYIDRFERLEDYNVGGESTVDFLFAPRLLGSTGTTLQFLGNHSTGYAFSPLSFIRGEIGAASRISRNKLSNSLLRGEVKYYSVLGSVFAGERFLGRHTLALGGSLDYGFELDKDRQFLLGADTGLRGYPARTFSGTHRFTVNAEDRIHIADDIFRIMSVGAAVFADAGAASSDILGSLLSNRVYSDVGIGLRIGFPRSSGGGIIRFDIAFPLRDGPPGDGTSAFSPRFIVGAGQLFGARLRSESVGPEKATIEVGIDR